MSLPAGSRLGPYEVVSFIGAGAMGVVYKARDTRLGRHVAIKVLPPAFARDPDRVARFEREARTAISGDGAAGAARHVSTCRRAQLGRGTPTEVARERDVDFQREVLRFFGMKVTWK